MTEGAQRNAWLISCFEQPDWRTIIDKPQNGRTFLFVMFLFATSRYNLCVTTNFIHALLTQRVKEKLSVAVWPDFSGELECAKFNKPSSGLWHDWRNHRA